MNYTYNNETISSKTNEIIKTAKKLYESKYRKLNSQFIIEGEKFVFDNAKNGFIADYIIADEKYRGILGANFAEAIYYVTPSLYKYLSVLINPQGIMGIYKRPFTDNDNIVGNRLVLLDNVQNPDNVGAIIRSAVCAGYDAVLLNEGCAACYSQKSVRAAAGSLFQIKIYDISFDIIHKLVENDYQLICSDINGDENINGIKDKYILVVGNEGNGISENILHYSDKTVRIPISDKCESLNAACAATVLMYKLKGY